MQFGKRGGRGEGQAWVRTGDILEICCGDTSAIVAGFFMGAWSSGVDSLFFISRSIVRRGKVIICKLAVEEMAYEGSPAIFTCRSGVYSIPPLCGVPKVLIRIVSMQERIFVGHPQTEERLGLRSLRMTAAIMSGT